MIYEETYRYLLRHVNSTEFDTCLYSVLHMDWDGVIQSPIHQMAKGIGTTEKYIKKIIKKFSSVAAHGNRRIFIPIEQKSGKYQFNLGPTPSFTNKHDRYCKKYRFFYTDTFRNLPMAAKRLVLMAAFKMSVNKSENLILKLENITELGGTLAKRNQILNTIGTINNKFGDALTISMASSTFNREEILHVSFRTGTLQDYLENRTERVMLRKTLYEAGYSDYIEDKVCIELERVGKYIFRSFHQATKAPIKDELLKLARFVYRSSLQKLGSALSGNKHLLAEPKEASAYFSAIVYNEVLNQMATFAHQAACIKDLMEREHFHREISEKSLERYVDYSEVQEHIEPILQKHALAGDIHKTLNKWCEDWVISRVRSVTGTNEDELARKRALSSGQTLSDYLGYLKKHTYDQLERQMAQYQHVLHGEDVLAALRQKKETMRSYFAIQKDRHKK